MHLVKKFETQYQDINLKKQSSEYSIFAIHDTKGLKLLTRLRLNFSHLNEHKFRHGFKDSVDPMCKCGVETELTLHFLLRCRLYY